jgi:hypothetical protein
MKAKLFKKDDEYRLYVDDVLPYATSDNSPYKKLSKQNCDEIFGVVDVQKLAGELYSGHVMAVDWQLEKSGFIKGFNKAMELNKDKVFTLEEVMLAWDAGVMSKSILGMFSGDLYAKHLKEHRDSYRQSIQQPTEIEVEIEMKKVVDETKIVGSVKEVKGSGNKITTYKSVPKLDVDGCLTLKRI